MRDDEENLAAPKAWPEVLRKIRARTPARIFVERASSYSTRMQQDLRAAHADAVDAVWTEFDLHQNLPAELVARHNLFQVTSRAKSKSQFLLRPDLGRKLSDPAQAEISCRCRRWPDIQIVIGDGLSSTAITEQVPALLPLLEQQACKENWTLGAPFAIRYCRVGIMNDIGDLLSPKVLILLIGERPGLATAVSLSAYMAFQPRSGHTDAHRNLISNIHHRGLAPAEAVARIIALAATMLTQQKSGAQLSPSTANSLPPL